uniref:Uncharacterized protein n=1 Tax=Thermosporothrix sp. COM3 TaxID=2490863 RepID=A0A455SMV7_9CHLR|nr:hypothetical protein KTC_11550 [Thermosporothrix sp. COM3]
MLAFAFRCWRLEAGSSEEGGTEPGERGRVAVSQKRNVGEIVGAVKAEEEKAGASQQREERGSDPSWHS